MLTTVIPKLPMRDKSVTRSYYMNCLGFEKVDESEYDGYLMLCKENIGIHFFEFQELDPTHNYGQVYIRTTNIVALYASLLENKVPIHPNGPLQIKPWGQQEFSLLDPDHNLLTFGQGILTER